jgi:hypothetical protein
VAVALTATLQSLSQHDFDGLNNMLQIPFALPWFLLPIGTSDYVWNAWVTAGMGWANAIVVYLWLARRRRPDAMTSSVQDA